MKSRSRSRKFLNDKQYARARNQLRKWGHNPNLCPVCGQDESDEIICRVHGTWVDHDDHECKDEISKRIDYAFANIGPLFWDFDLATAQPTSITETVQGYIEDFADLVSGGIGLHILAANWGSGKTAGVVEILKHGIANNYRAKLVKMQEIITAYKRERDDEADFMDTLASVDLLVIDEIVTPVSEAQAVLFDRLATVIDDRYTALRPVFITGNLSEDDLGEHYPQIASRLSEMSELVIAPDITFRPQQRVARLARLGRDR